MWVFGLAVDGPGVDGSPVVCEVHVGGVVAGFYYPLVVGMFSFVVIFCYSVSV